MHVWCFELRPAPKAALCLPSGSSKGVVVLRPATTARFFKVPDLCRPHDFVSKLLSSTFEGLWQTEAASSGRTEADPALSHHPVRCRRAKEGK